MAFTRVRLDRVLGLDGCHCGIWWLFMTTQPICKINFFRSGTFFSFILYGEKRHHPVLGIHLDYFTLNYLSLRDTRDSLAGRARPKHLSCTVVPPPKDKLLQLFECRLAAPRRIGPVTWSEEPTVESD